MKPLEQLITSGTIELDGETKNILAHPDEKLNEHIQKVRFFLRAYLEENPRILKNFFNDLTDQELIRIRYEEFINLIYELADFHDVGKFNPKFQKNKMKNEEFIKKDEIPRSLTSTHHSYPSAIIFFLYIHKKYGFEDNPGLIVLPRVIQGHHTKVRSLFEGDYGLLSLNKKFSEYKAEIVYSYQWLMGGSKSDLKYALETCREQYRETRDSMPKNDATLSLFYNYIYSVLGKSDFIASSYSDKPFKNFSEDLILNNRIEDTLHQKMVSKFEEKEQYLKEREHESPLNKYRVKMFAEAQESLEDGLRNNNRVFYLKMPTGGGKTNTSLGLALKIIEQKGIDRLVYSLPYISLLEQNYGVLTDSLGLKDGQESRAIYSLNEFFLEGDSEDEVLTHDDFFEYPVICTTNVSLLEPLVKFSKKRKLRLASLTNSVVILDEIQSLPVQYWPELNYLLNEAAKKLNIYFILMSATVPSLEKLKSTRSQNPQYAENVRYLLKEPEKFYKNFKRNTIKGRMKTLSDESDDITNYLLEICNSNFEEGQNHGLIVVNTVDSSRRIYRELKEKLPEVNVRLLNSTLLPGRRAEIIEEINSLDDSDRYILVSTQSIEAGMDISMHFVIRDFSILESIEQVRGRCNRHLKRDNLGNVYLINIERDGVSEASYIYRNWRLKETKTTLESTDFSYDIEDIDTYFDNSIATINDELAQELKLTSADNIECWNKIKYEENNSPQNKHKNVFHLDIIEENLHSYEFFINTAIPKKHFSEEELDFLAEKRALKEEDIAVDGSKVLHLFKSEIAGEERYIKKKILRKQFSSILSKFTFTAVLPVDLAEIESYTTREGRYYMIPEDLIGEKEHHIYSTKNGINKDFFQLSNII